MFRGDDLAKAEHLKNWATVTWSPGRLLAESRESEHMCFLMSACSKRVVSSAPFSITSCHGSVCWRGGEALVLVFYLKVEL